MTVLEARNDIQNIEQLCNRICCNCPVDELFCPTPCIELEKAIRMPFEKLLRCYARSNGDLKEVLKYICRYKENENG
jgi:hypothetical protein